MLNEKEYCEEAALVGHTSRPAWQFSLNAPQNLYRITGGLFAQLEDVCGVWYL
jgi:hypothetical protein